MVVTTQPLTAEAFDQFAELPENADKLLELIGGEIVEVPSNTFVSMISGIVFGELYIFIRGKDIGYLTGEAGGYMVSGERYAPDVAYISKEKEPELAKQGYNPNPPDLAVEVDFPSTYQSQEQLRIKIANYLAAGTVVWVVYPHNQKVEIYVPGTPVKILDINGIIDGEPVLPGFKLPVKNIFPG
jgi:Uma2 family endonuclease